MKTLWLVLLLIVAMPSAYGQNRRQWDPFLDTLQHHTIRWFLEVTPEKTGLTPDRWPSKSFCSIAAVGFALTSYPIAAEHGQISRTEAEGRVLTTLRFLWNMPQSDRRSGAGGYRGFFYHFINMQTGVREWDCELSTVDTGLLMLGILSCQSYFDEKNPEESEIRSLADSLYRRVDWKWAMGDSAGILMGWTPEQLFHHMTWHGYNEGQFVYILALGSPTHPVPTSAYGHWLSTYQWDRHYGHEYIQFAPLFGHQYTQCWIDLKGIRDSYTKKKGVDYFEVSRRATLSQWNYVKENPHAFRDYSDAIWGLTACDGPKDTTFSVDGTMRQFIGYGARGTSSIWSNDDGTMTPTAPGGSLPFAPEICIPALKAMRQKYGEKLFTRHGFRDAFNPTYLTEKTPEGWFDVDYLGIDQGPIVLMVENLRNGFVWGLMKKNPYIVEGLKRAGFTGGWLDRKK